MGAKINPKAHSFKAFNIGSEGRVDPISISSDVVIIGQHTQFVQAMKSIPRSLTRGTVHRSELH